MIKAFTYINNFEADFRNIRLSNYVLNLFLNQLLKNNL